MRDYTALLADAARLSVEDRLQLIAALWETVPEDFPVELSPAWQAEIEQRTAAFEAGEVTATPWQEIEAAARDRVTDRPH